MPMSATVHYYQWNDERFTHCLDVLPTKKIADDGENGWMAKMTTGQRRRMDG